MHATNYKLNHMPKRTNNRLNDAFLDAAYSTHYLINLSKRTKPHIVNYGTRYVVSRKKVHEMN